MALRHRRLGCCAFLLAAGACGRQGRTTTHDTLASASTASAAGSTGRPACPKTGHWTACQVRTRLEQAGVAPRSSDARDDLPTLGPRPITYIVGSAGLAIYLFPDRTARERAARTLDPTKFIAPASALSMRGEATVIQNDNLLGLLFSRSEQQRERVSDALSAGPPQP